jgi:hypothetical protein
MRATATGMAVVMLATALPLQPARAGMVGTETVIAGGTAATELGARERVRAVLARDDIRAKLQDLGIVPAEAEARLAALTDAEVKQLAGRLDSLPAGAGAFNVILIVFFVFGILVLADVLGLADIFNFVCRPGQCGPGPQALAVDPAADVYAVQPEAGPYETRRSDYYGDERRRAWLESQEYSEQDYLRGQAPIQQSDQYLYDAPPSDRDYRAERLGPRALR